MARPIKDISGQRFGKLEVLKLDHIQTHNQKTGELLRQGIPYWLCKCECGVAKAIRGHALKTGVQTSCGCGQAHIKHGMEGTKVYNVWASMKARCSNPNHKAYHNYGGRGIKVCDEWQDFEQFYADMGDPNGRVIDRINVDGNYEPNNCRWTDWSTSNKNQRRYLKES